MVPTGKINAILIMDRASCERDKNGSGDDFFEC